MKYRVFICELGKQFSGRGFVSANARESRGFSCESVQVPVLRQVKPSLENILFRGRLAITRERSTPLHTRVAIRTFAQYLCVTLVVSDRTPLRGDNPGAKINTRSQQCLQNLKNSMLLFYIDRSNSVSLERKENPSFSYGVSFLSWA